MFILPKLYWSETKRNVNVKTIIVSN